MISWYKLAQKSKDAAVKELMKKYTGAGKKVKESLQKQIIERMAELEILPPAPPKPQKPSKEILNDLALDKNLAKKGITRTEELFLKNIPITVMSRDQRIEMRRSIENKKRKWNETQMYKFRQNQEVQKVKALNDTKTQEYNQKQKFAKTIEAALSNNKNIHAILKENEDLNLDILVKLTKDKEIGPRFTVIKPKFEIDLNKFIEMYHTRKSA